MYILLYDFIMFMIRVCKLIQTTISTSRIIVDRTESIFRSYHLAMGVILPQTQSNLIALLVCTLMYYGAVLPGDDKFHHSFSTLHP